MISSVLENERKPTSNNTFVRTLFEIIRSEESPNPLESESVRETEDPIQVSSNMRLFDALAIEREMIRVSSEEPMRMSLMDMLEEGGEDEDEGGGRALMAEMACCCVCMVRNKDAAFIPCGHTFCRRCSRELWVKRGNCPLCNSSILEVLDIF